MAFSIYADPAETRLSPIELQQFAAWRAKVKGEEDPLQLPTMPRRRYSKNEFTKLMVKRPPTLKEKVRQATLETLSVFNRAPVPAPLPELAPMLDHSVILNGSYTYPTPGPSGPNGCVVSTCQGSVVAGQQHFYTQAPLPQVPFSENPMTYSQPQAPVYDSWGGNTIQQMEVTYGDYQAPPVANFPTPQPFNQGFVNHGFPNTSQAVQCLPSMNYFGGQILPSHMISSNRCHKWMNSLGMAGARPKTTATTTSGVQSSPTVVRPSLSGVKKTPKKKAKGPADRLHAIKSFHSKKKDLPKQGRETKKRACAPTFPLVTSESTIP